jgi:hypothetical protein
LSQQVPSSARSRQAWAKTVRKVAVQAGLGAAGLAGRCLRDRIASPEGRHHPFRGKLGRS